MLINNKEDYEAFYPYPKGKIKEYPREYPCICIWKEEGGGLMGEYRQVYVTYFPKDVETIQEAFIQGVNAKWEKIK
jgi:hypothetical protein